MSETLDRLRGEIDEWVEELLARSPRPEKATKKIVRDAVHGYISLEAHEVAVIDTPIVQRLRYIHQTALAYLVYPSATHTRFEHSLGVLQAVDNMAAALRRDHADLVEKTVVTELRLAAILHDTGHVLFSHLGESIMDERFGDMFEAIKTENKPMFAAANAGEILTYAIITGDPFRTYLETVANDYEVEFDIERIASYIIGYRPNDLDAYKTDMLNGPFDADKLDYLLRDCHFCGIQADVDVERFYQTLSIWKKPGMPRYLVMNQTGIPILEQILFSKMMLFTAIYHHQKIRALECMVRAAIHAAWRDPGTIQHPRLRFDSIGDFLRVSEYDFFSQGLAEEALSPMIQAILDRRLLKRALMISMQSVSPETQKKVFSLDMKKTQEPEALLELRQRIFDEIPSASQTSVADLWLDLPKGPDLNEDAVQCFVNTYEDEPQALSELFPTDDWLTSYEQNKWRGHVFYAGDSEQRRAAATAAETVFRDEFGIEFLPLAKQVCKL